MINKLNSFKTVAVAAFIFSISLGLGSTVSAKEPDTDKRDVLKNYGNLPMRFEANVGQTDAQVKFISRGGGYTMYLTSDEAVLVLSKPAATPETTLEGIFSSKEFLRNEPMQLAQLLRLPADPLLQIGKGPIKAIEAMDIPAPETSVLRMKLIGANSTPAVTALMQLPGITNYFIGNDPNEWHTNVPSYAKIEYKEVYEGVDLVYYGNQRQLEFDFVVAPGADPNLIKLDFEGAERLEIDEDGDFVIHLAGGELRLHKPIIYQEVNGNKEAVSGGYVLQSERQVSFEVADYDAGRPLVIDPILSYSTYLGGSAGERGWGIAVDGSGSAYVTGDTRSTNFPTENPFQGSFGGVLDVFVTKFDPSGSSLAYSTYLGGSEDDRAWDIAVDGFGSAYVAGLTKSSNFPTANPFQSFNAGGLDVFVTKLDPSGSALVYSTYLGGSSNEAGFGGIAVDGSGSAYVTGRTQSTNFPTENPFQGSFGGGFFDVFVTKFDPSGSSLAYSTYLGGSSSEEGLDIAVDGSGSAYVTGGTRSTNFPTASPLQGSIGGPSDVFVTKLDPSGSSLAYSTYLGGSSDDEAWGIAVDGSGSAYVAGWTESTNFPTANPFQGSFGGVFDVFVTKFDPSGSALVYSTYLGGSGDEWADDIAVDGSGSAYVTGGTSSNNFPTTANAFQGSYGGSGDVFVTKFDPSGSSLAYSTYLGGSSYEEGLDIAVDGSGSAYISGDTESTDFPTANPFQSSHSGGDGFFRFDVFVTKLTLTPEEAVALLISEMDVLAGTGELTGGQVGALITKLDAVIKKVGQENIEAAINLLQAFINQVNALINAGQITPEEGQPLIDAANGIINSLGLGKPAIARDGNTAKTYALSQNHPNPFNPETRISFELPEAGFTRIIIYNQLGRQVARLVDGYLGAGYHEVTWNASNAASGMYFYRLQAGKFTETRKMILLK